MCKVQMLCIYSTLKNITLKWILCWEPVSKNTTSNELTFPIIPKFGLDNSILFPTRNQNSYSLRRSTFLCIYKRTPTKMQDFCPQVGKRKFKRGTTQRPSKFYDSKSQLYNYGKYLWIVCKVGDKLASAPGFDVNYQNS